MEFIRKLFNSFKTSLYPNKCVCCGEFIDEDKYICADCDKILERNNFEKLCLNCGLEKEKCVCKYNVYRFNALVCVYKNEGLAQNTYYKYKFGRRQFYAKFFASEMVSAINICFSNINFDYVCSVPSYKKFTYKHCDYIAEEISKNLNVPFARNFLSCIKRVKKQHQSTIKERVANVDNKYICNYRIDGARILLVDDIKTTGATLDECAKVLLFAGAESVHCISVLGTTN